MLFSLDVIRARKGDCLMLHYGDKDNPQLVMIDGGPRGVYGPHLKPRLEQVRAKRGLGRNEPLTVDLLMVSHVDDDHIQGILDLTRELKEAQEQRKPQLVDVLSFWHNSFENIIGHTPKELTAKMHAQFGAASTEGAPPDDLTIDADNKDVDEETIVWNLKALASIKQGAQLRSDAQRLQFEINPEFDGKLIVAAPDPIDMGSELQFTVIGPMLPEIKALHKKHQAWLRELQKKGESPDEALAAYVDKSVPNLSSLVLLAEVDDRSMLLTGDARGDKILKGLESVGLVKQGGSLHVDLLKAPHHGSARNLDNDFFERITADHYVFSGNGEHGNPERESLEMLLAARGNDDYEVHLTYPIKDIDEERKKDWKKEQTKEKNKGKKPRPNWSVEKHSLAALLTKNKKFAKKVRIVEDGKPHVIDLLDKADV